MKIIRLQAKNIKKLTAVELTPDMLKGELIQISGKNGAGKSSVLDCIWYAIGGQSAIPPQPIREGAEKAKIVVELGEGETAELIVTRKFSKDSTPTLEVVALGKHAAKLKEPQTVLNALLGTYTFDPLKFMQDEAKQFNILKKITKLDFAELDAANKVDYEERRRLNKSKSELDARIKAFGEFPASLPAKPLDSLTISQQIAAAHQENAAFNLKLQTRDFELDRARRNAQIATNKIARLEEELKQANEDKQRFDKRVIELSEPIEGELIDTSTLTAQLQNMQQTNSLIEQKAEYESLCAQSRKLFLDSEDLTAAMKEREEKKQKAIADAKFPVQGLSFGNGIVLYKGLPLIQASHAEKLRISVAILIAENPKLRVMRVENGESLDPDSLKLFRSLLKGNDWQCLMETVDVSGKVGVIIEDGHIKNLEK